MAKKRGRKIHNFYENLHFINKKLENGRTAAQCILCNSLLKNTGIERLILHRKKCHPDSLTDIKLTETTTKSELNNARTPEQLLLDQKNRKKFNNVFESLKYINTKTDGGKSVAQCLLCKAVLINTSVKRLQIHRKRCHAQTRDNEDHSSSSRESVPTVSASNVKRGRKLHNFYQDLEFITIKMDNGKTAAQCIICNIILKNTGIDRLRTHRKRCKKYATTSNVNDDTSYMDTNTEPKIKDIESSKNSRKRNLLESSIESSSEDDSDHDNIKIKPEEIWIEESNMDFIN